MADLLLVDDEAIVRIGVKTCVNWDRLGIANIYEASNGSEALRIIQDHSIDIIITDIKMSVMDGFSMLEKLRELPGSSPKIIVMSCYNDYENMRQAMEYGVKDFLFKPKMYPDDIEASIRKVLGTPPPEYDDFREGSAALLQEISGESYMEQFVRLISLIQEKRPSLHDAVQAVIDFLNRLMEFDTEKDSGLHVLSTILFQNLYEIKKCLSAEDFLTVLNSIRNRAEHTQSRKIPEELSEALQYIDLHLTDPDLCQEAVAEHAGLSVSHFCRLFKNVMGVSYSSYIVKKRISLAEELYKNTDMKIYEIARKVGYTNEKYFAKLYREQTGHSMKML